MTIEKIENNNIICAVVKSDEKVITDAQSALDVLMSAKYDVGTKNIVIDKKLIAEDFFILSSGLAGDILQKYINYGGRIAIYGDYSHYTSKPLKDFIYESNKGKDVFFVSTIEEAVDMVGVDFILNVVLNEHKKIVKAVAGDLTKAHRVGCEYLDKLYTKYIPKQADIVIVSQGGAPKDLNLYQTQKALDNSKHAVRDDGIIILVGSCKEGLGNPVFDAWFREASCPQDIIDRLAAKFALGGHKAAAVAQVMTRAKIFMVSDMDPDFVRSIFMTPFATVQEAYDAAAAELGADASVIVMPYGGSTLPKLK